MNVAQIDRTQQAMALLRQAMALLAVEGNAAQPPTADRLLRRVDVETLTGLKKTAIWSRIKAGTFPASVEIGPGVVRWRASEVQAWIAARSEN